jgi:hypothetical protein
MAMKQTLIFLVAIGMIATSCEKDPNRREPIYGRVLQARSNTPVDNALVRFMSYESSPDWGNGTYTVIATDTTGPDGTFEIPVNEEITDVQAFGLQSIYPDPSDAEYLIPFQESGRPVYLYLEAPGWLRVIGVDQGLNSDIINSMSVRLTPGLYGNNLATLDPDNYWEEVSDQRIFRVITHEAITVSYRYYVNGVISPWQQLPQPVIVPGLDTLTVEIPF